MSGTTAMKKQVFTTRTMTMIAMLSVISALLMRIEFALPFLPPFYKIDMSEVAVLIGGFAFGPWCAICIEFFKNILYLLFGGTSSAFVGELANFIMGCAFILPPVLLYQHTKTQKSAFAGLVLGTLCLTLVGGLINYFILLPMYSVLYQLPMDALIAMGQLINPSIHGLLGFVLLMTIPFNLLKGTLVSLIVWITYKKLSTILKGIK